MPYMGRVREGQGSVRVLMPAVSDVVASKREVHLLGKGALAARDGVPKPGLRSIHK